MHYVICNPETKRPYGKAWQTKSLSQEEIDKRLAKNPAMTIGLLLGPLSGVVDVECDSEPAAERYKELLGNVQTPAWRSKRGTHHLYKWDERLMAVLAVVKIDGIEYRLGGSAAAQSICPPSVVEGVKREWLSGLSPAECELAVLPESIIELLLHHKVETRQDYSGDPLFADLESELQEARVTKIEAFLTRHKLGPSVVYEHDGRITLLLGRCPFKPVGHDNGDSHVTVFQNGVHAFHCYHTKDNRKTWQDVEEILGDRLDPVIKIGADVHRAIAESIAALAADPTVYRSAASWSRWFTPPHNPTWRLAIRA